jgi:hypothetical protein
MAICCQECGRNAKVDPVAITCSDHFIYKMRCAKCGELDVTSSVYLLENWISDYVNANAYPTLKEYLNKIINCDIPCYECPYSEMCYTGKFFFEVQKDQLREEQINSVDPLDPLM